MPKRPDALPPPRRPVPRRPDGPLPTPLVIDVERGRWRAGYCDWDEAGQEFRVDGEMFDNAGAAWEQSQEMVAEEKTKRTGR